MMSYCKDKVCEACGRERASWCSSLSVYLCDKHKRQVNKYGYLLDNNPRTINDLNEIRVVGNIAYINLYNNKNEHIYTAIIDAEDVSKVSNFKWRVTLKRNKPYVITGRGAGNQKYLARFILDYNGELEVDHIDGDTLNNCKNNLRCVSHKDNIKNIKPKSNNQFGIRGISKDNRSNKYTVDFRYEHERYYIKPWEKFEDAVLCRYYFELMLNPLRYTGNDEQINNIIKDIDEMHKQEIYNYVVAKIQEKKNAS